MVHSPNGILYSNENEWSKIPNDMHKSHKHNVQQKKPDTEEHNLYDSIYIESSITGKANLWY